MTLTNNYIYILYKLSHAIYIPLALYSWILSTRLRNVWEIVYFLGMTRASQQVGQVKEITPDLKRVPMEYHQYIEVFSKDKSRQISLTNLMTYPSS